MLGTNVDGAVRRISTTYEVRGQLEKITSYDNASVGSGSVVNEVLREYNDLGLLDKEYQEHDGAKDANTPYVGYNYDVTASGAEFTKGLRAQSIRYPNGRLVHYTYGSSGSDADNLNRLDAIKDDNSGSPGDTLASYTYLGLGQMVIEDYEEPEVRLDYFGGTSGTYAGFDRFNRIIDHRWYDYGASEDRDRFKYGYDRASNRTWKENVVSKNLGTPVYLDEFYSHDGVNRLTDMDRGELNGTKTGITDTPSREEGWTLDPLGNWSNYIQKTSGTTDLDQDRTVNKANEIADIDETTGTSWATPVYDHGGNMTSIPRPDDLSNSFQLTWDAWNRLAKVKAASGTLGEYTYDGLSRRVTKDVDNEKRHQLYSWSWQLLEERPSSYVTPDRQWIWGPLYIDHLILRDRDTSDPVIGDLDERIFTLQDVNWNVSCLLIATGEVTERYTYDLYGPVTLFDAFYGPRSLSSHEWEICFSGQRTDDETGLHHYRTRMYDGRLGCFLNRDARNGLNLYSYVDGRPTALVDPLGREPIEANIRIAPVLVRRTLFNMYKKRLSSVGSPYLGDPLPSDNSPQTTIVRETSWSVAHRASGSPERNRHGCLVFPEGINFETPHKGGALTLNRGNVATRFKGERERASAALISNETSCTKDKCVQCYITLLASTLKQDQPILEDIFLTELASLIPYPGLRGVAKWGAKKLVKELLEDVVVRRSSIVTMVMLCADGRRAVAAMNMSPPNPVGSKAWTEWALTGITYNESFGYKHFSQLFGSWQVTSSPRYVGLIPSEPFDEPVVGFTRYFAED